MIEARARSSTRPSKALVTGEFDFLAADFHVIAEIAKADAGIDLPEAKATLVYSRLAKRVRALGLATFEDYCRTVSTDGEERRRMIAALTTNVTRFFREPHHFEHLRKKVLEPATEYVRDGGRLRLWSAACSTGQEPYSMALTVLSVFPNAAELDVRILATDLNPHVVAHGRNGQYRKEEIADIPANMRSKWLEAVPGDADSMRLCEQARSLVSFRELNLMGTWPFKGPFSAIFCRNVVIYFDRETQGMIWRRLSNLLINDGSLYIGHSERVSGPATNALTADGITTYRRKTGGR